MTAIAASAPLTLGIIAGTIIAAILILVGIAAVLYGVFSDDYDRHLATGLGIVTILATSVVYLFAAWPLSYEYHHWIPTEGTVATVGRRIVSDGDGNVSQKFVIRFTDGRVRALNDSIGSTLREGDRAVLKCKRAYDFGVPRSSHGWDCKWAGTRS